MWYWELFVRHLNITLMNLPPARKLQTSVRSKALVGWLGQNKKAACDRNRVLMWRSGVKRRNKWLMFAKRGYPLSSRIFKWGFSADESYENCNLKQRKHTANPIYWFLIKILWSVRVMTSLAWLSFVGHSFNWAVEWELNQVCRTPGTAHVNCTSLSPKLRDFDLWSYSAINLPLFLCDFQFRGAWEGP